MAFHPLDRSENAAGWLSAIILTPICVFATMLRFYATKRCGRALAWDDFWAFFGLIFYIPYAVYLLMRKSLHDLVIRVCGAYFESPSST